MKRPQNKLTVLEGTTAGGTVLKGPSVRKAESRCSKACDAPSGRCPPTGPVLEPGNTVLSESRELVGSLAGYVFPYDTGKVMAVVRRGGACLHRALVTGGRLWHSGQSSRRLKSQTFERVIQNIAHAQCA